MTIQFTPTVCQNRKGEGYMARADELGVRSEPSKTGSHKYWNQNVR
jgi:hypothetical protein